MPGQTLLHELLHERIGIELLYIIYTWTAPQALEEHQGTDRSGYARRVAHALSTRLLVSGLMAAVVPDVVGLLLAVLDPTDTTADGGLAGVVLTELSGVGEDRLEELDRYDLYAVVEDGVDAGDADVLHDA